MCVCACGGGGGALGQKCYCTRAECIVSTLKCFLTQRSVDRYLKALQIVFSASTLFPTIIERENASFSRAISPTGRTKDAPLLHFYSSSALFVVTVINFVSVTNACAH